MRLDWYDVVRADPLVEEGSGHARVGEHRVRRDDGHGGRSGSLRAPSAPRRRPAADHVEVHRAG